MRLARVRRLRRGRLIEPTAGIRHGRKADLAAVHALNLESFPESWSLEGLTAALDEGYELFVCTGQKGELAGYILSHDIIDETHLLQLAVEKQFRRTGIGSELVRFLARRKRAAGNIRLLLEVRASNKTAQQLYTQLGFAFDGIRRSYYTPAAPGAGREDAVLMSLDLDRLP